MTAHVVDLDGSAPDAVRKGTRRYGSRIKAELRDTEFIGDEDGSGTDREQRDRAQAEYARIVTSSGARGARQLWNDLHVSPHWKLASSEEGVRVAHDAWNGEAHPRGKPKNRGQFRKKSDAPGGCGEEEGAKSAETEPQDGVKAPKK